MAIRSWRVVAAAALLALSAQARSRAAGLTLPQAVAYALSHSPSISKQIAAVSQLRSAYVKARSLALPGVTGTLQNQMQKSQNYAGVYSIIGAPQASVYSQNTASIGTSYTFNGGLSSLQELAAKEAYEQANVLMGQTQAQVTLDVTNAYYALASKLEAARLDEGDLSYQSSLLSVARAKERAGVAAGVDVLSASAQVEKSRYTLEAARADAEDARESLAQTIGAPLTADFQIAARPPAPPLPAQPLDELIALAIGARPEVRSAQEAVAIAQTNRREADTDLFPQIQTFASVGNQFSPTLAAAQARFGPVARGTPGYWNLGITSQISVPFWDWGARRAAHRDLDEQIAAAADALTAQKAQVEIDVRRSYRAAQTALAQLASARDETRYAVEAARVAKLQYQNGLITLVDVQQRAQSALSAQADLYNARVAYVNAIVKLRVALGIETPQQDVADLR